MRLIDADATKRRVADTFFDTLIPCVNHALDDSPTIDAVPVVRCRECTEFDETEHECSHWYGFRENDFCSHGVLKEGADNEP